MPGNEYTSWPGAGGVVPPPPSPAPAPAPAAAPAPAVKGGKNGAPGSLQQIIRSPVKDPAAPLAGNIQGMVGDAMSGKLSSFTPQVVEGLDQQAVMSRDAADKQTRDQVMRQAVMSGMSRSPATAAILAQGLRQNSATASNQMQQTRIQKAHQDYSDRMQGLQSAQQYLEQARSWVLNSEKTDMEKSKLLHQFAAASAAAAAQQQQLQIGLAQQMMAENGPAWNGQ